MSIKKFQSGNELNASLFVALLKYYDLYHPKAIYKVLCPFHEDKNASMQINIPGAFFYCYGCGAQGSTLELYKMFQQKKGIKTENLTDLKCMLEIQKLCKSPVRENNIYNKNNIYNIPVYSVEKLSYKDGISVARDFYYNLPEENWYKPGSDEGRECKRYMHKRGFSSKILLFAGAKPSYSHFYPIVFPLLENNVFRGYVMRTFDPDVEANRKYMYNKGFRRAITLAGNYEKGKPLLIVEGYLDYLKAKQLGIKNVVAILGWKLSSQQIKKLKKAMIPKVICGLDNDEAGKKGYKYCKFVLPKQGIEVVRLKYPKGKKDIGEIEKGTEAAEIILRQLKKI